MIKRFVDSVIACFLFGRRVHGDNEQGNDRKKHSKRPKGTYTLDDNGEVIRSAPVGHPSGRTDDPSFPSRTTDPRPGISDVQATDPRPGISGVQASTKNFIKSTATSDLKSGPESGKLSDSSIFSNPSVSETSLLRAGSNSKFGKTLKQDSALAVDHADPVNDLIKSSKPKKKANVEPDAHSPPPVDYLSEADHILLDLEEFDHTCETKCRPSVSNPSHGSREKIRNSKWLTGQSSHSIKDKLSSDDVDGDFNVDELLAYYHRDTSQANQKTVAAESPMVTAKLPQVEKISISARLKKIRQEIRDRDLHANQNTDAETAESPVVSEKHPQLENISERPKKLKKINRKMRNPDPRATEYLAGKDDARVHINVPKRRPKKTKQYEVTGTNHFIDETEPITTLENYKEKPRPDTPLPSASYVSNSPSDEFAAMHRTQPPAIMAKKKKLKYTHDNVIPTLPSRHSPSSPTALDEFIASTQSLPHPLQANKKTLQYTNDNIIPTLPSRHSPSPPTTLDEFVASTKSLPHPLQANKKKLQYTYDNVIPTLPSRPSPSPPTALDEFVASTQSLPHPLLANKKKLQYTYDNVIPTLPSRPSPSPPTALDEFIASTKSLPHPLLANKKKLQYTYDNVIPTLPSRPSPSPPTALDEFIASTQSLPHPLLANKKKLQYTYDNVIPTLPSRPSPSPPTALDEFIASTQSLPHPLLANMKKLQYTYDNVIPTLPSRPSPSPPTALDEFAAKFPAESPPHSNTILSTNSSQSSTSYEVAEIHSNRKHLFMKLPRFTAIVRKKDARSKPPKQTESLTSLKKTQKKKKSKTGETSTLRDDDRPSVTQTAKNAQSLPLSQTESQPTIMVLQGYATSEIHSNRPHLFMKLPRLTAIFRKKDACSKPPKQRESLPPLKKTQKKKSKTDETSTLRDDDRPSVTKTARNVQSLPLSQPTIMVLQGHATSEPTRPILNIRHIIIDSRDKKKKKSFLKRLIPCLRASKEDKQAAKYEINATDSEEYLEINDVESSPPKVLRTSLRTRITSFLSSFIGRH